jgi:predicted phosphodiesterase
MCGYGKPQGQKVFLLRQFMEDKPGEGDGTEPQVPPIQALVFGHNREAQARPGGGVFFFNPGSFSGHPPEGKRESKRTVGLLYLIGTKWDGHITEFKY